MYNFTEVPVCEIDAFSEEQGIFFQTSAWADFKNKYKHVSFIGKDENGETVLTCLLFLISVPCTPFKIGYAMRGFVCDYTNEVLVGEFTEFLHKYMKKNHIVYTAIDPFYTYKTDFEVTEDGGKAHQTLLDLGYIHFADKAHSIQRPTNYLVRWDPTMDKKDIEKTVFAKMEKKLQNDIRIAEERGLVPEKYHGDEITDTVIDEFFKLFEETAEAKGFGIRQRDYYVDLIKHLRKYITIHFYRYDYNIDKEYTENVIHEVEAAIERNRAESEDPNTTPQKRERLKPKMAELLKQLNATKPRLEVTEKYKDKKYISVYLCIKCGTKAHDYFGANSLALRELRLTSNYWDMMKDCFDGKTESLNMGGTLRLDTEDIKKDKTYDLYQYKSRYHGQLDELLGEYYLVSNKFLYEILHNKVHWLRRVVFKN